MSDRLKNVAKSAQSKLADWKTPKVFKESALNKNCCSKSSHHLQLDNNYNWLEIYVICNIRNKKLVTCYKKKTA